MSADRIRDSATSSPDATEDLESILRDLEQVIRETLPPAQAEAYVLRLRHLLSELGYKVTAPAGRLPERKTDHR